MSTAQVHLLRQPSPGKHLEIWSDDSGQVHIEFHSNAGKQHLLMKLDQARTVGEAILKHVQMRASRQGLVTL